MNKLVFHELIWFHGPDLSLLIDSLAIMLAKDEIDLLQTLVEDSKLETNGLVELGL